MGFHLKAGEWIVQNHRPPAGDTFTYTAAGHDYIDMEWLYQVTLFMAWKAGGYVLLSLGHIGFALLALFLLWSRLKGTGADLSICTLLFLVAVIACEPRFRVRPELVSWFLLSLELWILEQRQEGCPFLLWLLPVLQLFWVNTEGLFFLGPLVMGFYVLTGPVRSLKLDRKMLRITVLCMGVCFLNPYFIQGALFPVSFLSTLGSSGLFQQMVQEFQPPWSYVPVEWASMPWHLWVYKIFCFFFLFLLVVTARSRQFRDWVFVFFFFLLSMAAIRNIPIFMVACMPIAARCCHEVEWSWFGKIRDSALPRPWFAWVLAIFLLGFSARIVTNAHYVSDRLTDRFGLGLDTNAQPVKACQFLLDHHLDGRILNDLDDGDWLDWQGPQPTFLDGRLDVMGKDLFEQYVQSRSSDGIGLLLERYQPDILFFDPLVCPQWALALQGLKQWRLVYLDGLNAIYLKDGYAEQIPTLNRGELLATHHVPAFSPADAFSLLQLNPRSSENLFLEDLVKPVDYPNDLLNLGIFSSYTGDNVSAESFLLEAIRRTQGRFLDFYYDLGLVEMSLGKKDAAVSCMRRVLREKPGDPMARRIVGQYAGL